MSTQIEFRTTENNRLPRLAWCAEIESGAKALCVKHGPWLEVGADYALEGAWNGAFDCEDVQRSDICLASGVIARNGEIVIVVPSHTLSRLYALRRDERLYISNSMPFVLVAAGEEIDPQYVYYEDDLRLFDVSLHRARRRVPTASGNSVHLLYFQNVVVGADLVLRERPRPEPPPFDDFEFYRDYLVGATRALADNARDPARRRAYRMIVGMSRGYDSTACAAIATQAGCIDAFTAIDSRDADDPLRDSGAPAGRALGFNMRTFELEAYKSLPGFAEAEFLVHGSGGGSVFLAGFEHGLEQRMLISGFEGDLVWGRILQRDPPHVLRTGGGGADLDEFRLRAGFVHAPLPFFGFVHHYQIKSLAFEEAMKPWRLGAVYDRPIARRLAEEAGVPRDAFGQDKMAVSRGISSVARMPWYFGDASYRDMEAFGRRLLADRRLGDRLAFVVMHALARAIDGLLSLTKPVSWRTTHFLREWLWPLSRYSAPADVKRYRFHWSMSKIRPRYDVGGEPFGAP